MLLFRLALLWTVQFMHCLCDSFHAECGVISDSYGRSVLPLIVTPLLGVGRIQEAQDASRVVLPDNASLISHSGFFTVNEEFNSNMFFWFFPAANGNKSAPVLLWLQGGPGASVMTGIFLENGPFSVANDLRLKPRRYSWTSSHSVLYIDNPVGTGFSFTEPGGYSTTEYQVTQNLYSALVQFFTLFPCLQANEFFVTGESYAGKFIPQLCQFIHQMNPTSMLKINLKGLAIGNAYCDPASVFSSYGDYLYQIALLDANGRELFKRNEREIVEHIERKQWKAAYDKADLLINGDTVALTIFKNLTGFSFKFNYLYKEDWTAEQSALFVQFISSTDVRNALHVGNSTGSFEIKNPDIRKFLKEEVMQSVTPLVEELLENYRVLFFTGHIDILIPYPFAEKLLDKLCWSGAEAYRTARRTKWYVGKDLAGYSKVAKNLCFLVVRNAGHQVPADQPEWALEFISKFVKYEPF